MRTGYTFAGWSNGGAIELGSTGEKTFTASWTPIAYVINYNLNGGTNAQSNPATYTIEEAVELAAPTRTGYTFAGWSNDGAISLGSIGEKTFTASWEIITYTVSYNLNGGTNAQSNPATYTVEDEITLAAPTKTGYTFTGWSNGGAIELGSTGEKTFTASWTPIEYAIHYNLNGGTNAQSNPATYTIEEAVALAAPTRTGYTFIGWTWQEQIEPQLSVTIPIGTHENKSYAANWEANTYVLTFNANGGVVDIASKTVTYDDAYTLPVPERVGYTFTGWYEDSTEIEDGTWLYTAGKALTAHWNARNDISYQVKHYQQNIENSGYTLYKTQNLTGTADATITPAAMTYTGFTAPQTQTVTVKPDGSLIVNYYYTRNTYTITFTANNASAPTSFEKKYGDDYPSVPTPTRAGFTFGGWFVDEGLTTLDNRTTVPAGDCFAFAWWIAHAALPW